MIVFLISTQLIYAFNLGDPKALPAQELAYGYNKSKDRYNKYKPVAELHISIWVTLIIMFMLLTNWQFNSVYMIDHNNKLKIL